MLQLFDSWDLDIQLGDEVYQDVEAFLAYAGNWENGADGCCWHLLSCLL